MIAWLTDTLVATSALIVLVLIVREPVRRHFGPRVAYALWLLPALRSILPSFTITVERAAVEPASAGPDAIILSPATQLAEPSLFEAIGGWPAILLTLWLAGAAVMLVHGLLTYRAQRSAILRLAVPMAVCDRIRIVRSDAVTGPLAFGLFDRVIALPLDFDQRFSDRERKFALEHELAHHRSGDLVANTIAFVLLCLQWFNPLAWVAHAAFRFDQEAACDARVLDKADASDRSSYGCAIAKAASGRALLLAGALDRPSTLSRRLTIMTNSTHQRARQWGFLLIGGGLLFALPMTASYAVQYVDTAPPAAIPALRAPQPVKPISPSFAAVPTVPAIAAARAIPAIPLASAAGSSSVRFDTGDISFIGNDSVTINGVTKRWDELTPAERNRIRAEMTKARDELRRSVARLPQELAKANRDMEQFRNGKFERDMVAAREAMKNVAVDFDSSKGDLARSLREIEAMDFAKIARDAAEAANPARIEASLREATRSLDEIETKLNRLDGR